MKREMVFKAAAKGGKAVYGLAMDEVLGRLFGMLKIKILLPVLVFSGISWLFGFFLAWLIWG